MRMIMKINNYEFICYYLRYILINFNLKYELYQNYFLNKEQDKVQYHLYQSIKKKYYI